MNYKQAQEIRSLIVELVRNPKHKSRNIQACKGWVVMRDSSKVDTLLRVLIVVGVIALIISGMLHIGRIEQSRQELIKTEGQESQHIVLAVSNIF